MVSALTTKARSIGKNVAAVYTTTLASCLMTMTAMAEDGSIGGFRTLPDYCFQTMPTDYAALVLIGGMQWNSPEAEQAVPLVKDALQRGKIVGAICNAASFMAKHGFLNNVKHTGNTIQQLKLWGGQEYTNEAGYEEKQAVSDQNIVTANGTGQLEFCRELLLLLKADTPENIHASYDFYKNGFVR